MHYIVTADTDIGTKKQTNQDSILVKHAECQLGEVLMAIVCDGMGGLAKGEVASATVIEEFSKWFDESLSFELENVDMKVISEKWSLLLKDLNVKIAEYGAGLGVTMGTTFTGVLFIKDEFLCVHVGDTRLYYLNSGIQQLTTDQTFVAREVSRGNMTPEQAEKDKRRNVLLQCVGASEKIEPEMFYGKTERGAYMICCDGFRHEITEKEIAESLNPAKLSNKAVMHKNCRHLIDQIKRRGEKDNISVLLIKAE